MTPSKNFRLIFRLYRFLNTAVSKLMESQRLQGETDVFAFADKYRNSDIPIIREFALSFGRDWPDCQDLMPKLESFQAKQFAHMLDHYDQALQDILQADEDSRTNFFADLTYLIVQDLEYYTQDRAATEESPQDPQAVLAQIKEAVDETASFAMAS